MDNYFGMIALDSNTIVDGDSDSGLIDIEMLRVGKFEHPRHGELDITDDLLSDMVKNFNNNVIGREVSFDWNHEAKKASAWLRNLQVEGDYLIGTVELTKSGRESVEAKEYGYFSIEFGEYEDPETGETYSPTIMGGALTNRPFISNLKKIEFSLEGENTKLYREVKEMPDIKREPAKTEQEEKVDVKLEELEALTAKNVALEDKLKKLEEAKETKKEEAPKKDVKLEEFIDAQKVQLEAMESRITKLQEANVALEEESKTAKEAAKVSEIRTFCSTLLNDEHHHPVVVETVKDILLQNPSTQKIYKFSETIGEGDEAKTRDVDADLMKVLSTVLASVPATQRADYAEKSTSDSISLTEKDQDELEKSAMKKAFARKNVAQLSAVK